MLKSLYERQVLLLRFGLALRVCDCCMCDENEDYTHINQLFYVLSLIRCGISRLGQIIFEEYILALAKFFQLIRSNAGEQYVLDSEEAKEEAIECLLTDSIDRDLMLLALLLLIRTSFACRRRGTWVRQII